MDATHATVVALLDPGPGATVIDVGCGTGLCFSDLIGRIGPDGRIVGIEQSVDMLGEASTRLDAEGWATTSPYVTTFEGFGQPWDPLARLVPSLQVDRHDLAGKFFAWGAKIGP